MMISRFFHNLRQSLNKYVIFIEYSHESSTISNSIIADSIPNSPHGSIRKFPFIESSTIIIDSLLSIYHHFLDKCKDNFNEDTSCSHKNDKYINKFEDIPEFNVLSYSALREIKSQHSLHDYDVEKISNKSRSFNIVDNIKKSEAYNLRSKSSSYVIEVEGEKNQIQIH